MRNISTIIFTLVIALFAAKPVLAGDVDALDEATMVVDNVLFIGDSYCMGAGVPGGPDAGWAELTAKKMKIEHYYRSCYGGTGFSKKFDERNFETLAENAALDIGDTQSIEWVVVEGGYNDRYVSDEDIINDGTAFLQYLVEAYPNAQILIGMNGWNIKDADIQEEMDRVLLDVQQLAVSLNVSYIADSENVLFGHSEYFTTDNFHPNAAGQEALAEHLTNYLQERANAYAAEKMLNEKGKKQVYTNTNYSFAFILVLLFSIGIAAIFNIRRLAATKKK